MWCSVSLVVQSVLACGFAVLLYQYLILQREIAEHAKPHASEHTEADDADSEPSVLEAGTSVWCRGSNPGDRLCRFQNLCYDPSRDEYVFLHGPLSRFYGIPPSPNKLPLVDLSSVEDHNVLQLMSIDIPVDKVTELYEINMIVQPSLLLYRFKPDNLMHVFHDDLLPLHGTLLEICKGSLGQCPQDLQLVFTDPWPEGAHWDLYTMFTRLPPLLMSSMPQRILYCFKEAYVGLNRKTVWYQYGFTVPQSPLPNFSVTALDIHRFTKYFASRLPQMTPSVCDHDQHFAILLSRKTTRLILNEADVVEAIAQETGTTVQVLSLDDHSFVDVLAHVRCADLLVGVHGALLVLAMFLKPGAIFIELFPYGIPPDDYTPYRTLATLPGMGIVYRAWRNTLANKTVTHPNWPADFGGIQHLTMYEQQRVETTTEVPRHLCCHNPTWLYRIYQDTDVDIQSFRRVLQEAVLERETLAATQSHSRELLDIINSNLLPGKVENLTCEPLQKERGVMVSWLDPWNLQVLPSFYFVQFEVWAQLAGEVEHKTYITNDTSHVIRGLTTSEQLNVWVRCKINDQQIGAFRWIGCKAEEVTKVDIKY